MPIEEPLDTRPTAFLEPYPITLKDFRGTYEDCKKFVEDLQTAKDDVLITVHCLKNEDGDNEYGYRTVAYWTMRLTVYFMNPEAPASGDRPPEPPGSQSC